MKYLLTTIILLVGFGLSLSPSLAQNEDLFDQYGVTVVTLDDIEWQESSVEGVRSAVVVGNPATEGQYALYGLMNEGSVFPPHAHPDDRLTTVLSGTMYYGTGSEYDGTNLQAYPAGSVIYTPAGVPHYMYSPIGNTLSQETGLGPTGLLDESEWHDEMASNLVTTATFSDIEWQASSVEGVRNTIMAGDPTSASLYALYGNMGEGATFPVHAHPDDRLTTVIAGTMYFGVGMDVDTASMVPLMPGSIVYTPAGVPHAMWTPDGDMLSQEAGYGPTGFLDESEWISVNPAS